MIDNLDDYIIGIVLGIRFRANFSIEDQLGRIMDRILYSKDSFFKPEIFPEVRGKVGKRFLWNEYTQDSLHVDNSNIILEVNFYEEKGFKKSDAGNILKNFEDQIINGIMKEFKIKEITRCGFVKRYVFPIEGLAKSFMDKTVGKTLEGVTDINLRFSKRLPVTEKIMKKGLNDYDNVIFNVVKLVDKDEIYMSIDYQSYFDPFLSISSEIPFKAFISRTNNFNKNKYLDWLNNNYAEEIQ